MSGLVELCELLARARESGRAPAYLKLPMAATVLGVPGAEGGLPVTLTAVLERTVVVEPRPGADRVLVPIGSVYVDPDLVEWVAPSSVERRPMVKVRRRP